MKAEAASQARPERTDAVSGKLAVGCSVRQEARCLDCADYGVLCKIFLLEGGVMPFPQEEGGGQAGARC